MDAKGGPVELHDFYVPAGGDIPDRDAEPEIRPQAGLHRRDAQLVRRADAGCARRCMVGDLNIAPLEHDVWSHKQLLDVVSHTPPETEGLNAWLNAGFVDAVRHFVPADQKLYTWWSYRNRDWRASDRGRRLDHVWVTPDLQGALKRHVDPEGCARLAAGLRPRAGVRGTGGVDQAGFKVRAVSYADHDTESVRRAPPRSGPQRQRHYLDQACAGICAGMPSGSSR